MAVINVRVDDEVRDALEDLAAAEGLSLSEKARDLLGDAVPQLANFKYNQRGDQPAPESLSFMERKTLSMLHTILSQVTRDPDDAEYEEKLAEAVRSGYTGEYWREAAGFATELTRQETRLLFDILQMFRVLQFSIRRQKDAGTPLDEKLLRSLSYRGFDFNDALEGQMASYVAYLIDDNRWAELKPFIEDSDGGNSHMEMLDVYRRMLKEHRRIMAGRERRSGLDDIELSLDELRRVAEARP